MRDVATLDLPALFSGNSASERVEESLSCSRAYAGSELLREVN